MRVAVKFEKNQVAKRKIAKADTCVIAVYAGAGMADAARSGAGKDGALIAHALRHNKFTAKAGQVLGITAPAGGTLARYVLLGLGAEKDLTAQVAADTGGKLYAALAGAGAQYINVLAAAAGAQGSAHMAQGFLLRSYSFDKYKKRSKKQGEEAKNKPDVVRFMLPAAAQAEKYFRPLHAAVEGVFLARDLVNEPPNNLYPASFVTIARKELEKLGVEVSVFDEKKMKQMGFHAHLAVGMGSSRPPRVLVMRWPGAGGKTKKGAQKAGKGPLAFVGKGVTFDTGGINLKPSDGMIDMKMDMSGAAVVTGLMKTLALRKSPAEVIAIAGLAENMPSHTAYRPSDILDSYNGMTIEMLNTDAEGRLVLADCLSYVQQKYKPRLVVNLATLTGAIMVALGQEFAGAFVNDETLWKQLDGAACATGEKLWRMPLDDAYRKELESGIADVRSIGKGRNGGSCTAAAFLEKFIEKGTPWAHLDIAGTAWISADKPTCPRQATGFGLQLLDHMTKEHYEK